MADRHPAAWLAALALMVLPGSVSAAASPTGVWLTEDRGGVVRVEPCAAALCGVIVGLSDWPPDGRKLDVHGRSQCHLTLLAGLVAQDDGRWHGTVTNPDDGRIYSAEVWVPADGILRLRGYVGLEIFGSTQLWPPYQGKLRDDCHFPPQPR